MAVVSAVGPIDTEQPLVFAAEACAATVAVAVAAAGEVALVA